MSENTKTINKEDKMVTESPKSPSGSSTKDKHSERYQSNKKKSNHCKERLHKRRSPSSSSRFDSEESDRSRHSSHRKRDRRTKRRHHRRDSRSSSTSSSPSRSRSSSSSSSRSRSYRRRDKKHYRSRKYESSRKYNNRKNRHGNKRRDSRERSERPRGDSTRSRTRSPHPLLRYNTATETPSVKSLAAGSSNANKFWDGFQWVDKLTGNQQEDPVVLNQTRKMRRFTISNVPFQLGVDEREIESFVTKFIMENYLNDQKTVQHVKEVTIDRSLNTATVELSSIEEASKLAKIDCINILGHSCRISRVGESKFGNAPTLVNLLTDAQRTAQARAAVIKAMDLLQNKDKGTAFQMTQPDLGTLLNNK